MICDHVVYRIIFLKILFNMNNILANYYLLGKLLNLKVYLSTRSKLLKRKLAQFILLKLCKFFVLRISSPVATAFLKKLRMCTPTAKNQKMSMPNAMLNADFSYAVGIA